MTHHEERAPVPAQELQQPGAGVGVEVVRRLVEQQEVTATEQDPHQLGAAPFTARQRAEGQLEAVGAQSHAVGELPHLRFGRVATRRLESLLRGAEALDVAVRRRLVHRDAQLLQRASAARRARARRARGRGPWCRRGRRHSEGPARGSRSHAARRIAPARGASAPPSTRNNVVLPAPFRPTRPTFSPGRTCSVTPSTIRLRADLDHQVTNGQHGKQLQGLAGGASMIARRRAPAAS